MKLSEKRKAAKLKVNDVCEALGVSRMAVYFWEHGKPPKMSNLIKLAKLYGCTLDELVEE